MMSIVFMGTPEFAVPSLLALIKDGYQVLAVYTKPDKPVGRGRRKVLASPIKQVADEHGILVFQPKTFRDENEIKHLEELAPEVIVVVAYGMLLHDAVLGIPTCGCINIHPSLLPKYRGASPIANAILAGDQCTGTTLMLLDSGMDTGPIIAQVSVAIGEEDTSTHLHDKLAGLSADLLIEALPSWLGGRLKAVPQNNEFASVTRRIKKSDGLIDWTQSVNEICAKLRAYTPWPGCFTMFAGKRLKIIEACLYGGGASSGQIGQVVNCDGQIVVQTGGGVLKLIKVQLEGKRVMGIGEFARGHKDFFDSILTC